MSSPSVSEESAITITANSQPDLAHVFSGNGEMAALMREFDWSKTPLGPVEQWPQSLKTSVSICLASRFPIVLYWGPELVVLYNDAYSVILGSKHPWALGQTCRVCWAEIWDTIGPMLDGVLKTGKATWSDDLLLMLRRFDYPEECYFSFSFSSVQVESGEVGGIFTAVIETTEKVIGERRLRTLRDLAARVVVAKSEQDAWQIAAGTLAENLHDVPFSILCEAASNGFRVAAVAGIESTHPLCAALCQPGSELFQKAMQVVQSGQRAELTDPGSWAIDLPSGRWDTAPHTAVLLPIAALGQGCSGLLFAAASPAKELDESYRTFFDLLARQIATNIADARADEEQRKRAEALTELDRAKTLFFSNISQSEERLRLAQQAAAIGTFEWNIETNVNRWTPELEAMYGLPPGGFPRTQEAWEQLVHPEDRTAAVRQVKIGLETGAPVQAEWRVIWPDGSIRWILGRWQAFKDKSGRPVRMAGINIDVTERREAEEARRRLAAIVESSDDAIASKDLNGIVTSWNKSAERMFGYKAEEIIGKPVLLIIPPELHRDEDMILSKIRRGERIKHFETVRVTKSGERIDVSLTISPVKDRNGNVIGAAKIVRNITENKKIEHALRTTEKLAAAGRLAATVAHEINNPLEAVTNLVYLANRDLPNATKVSGHLQLAARELNRVAHIARQTLGFYRDTSSPSTFSVTRMLDDLLFLYENRLQTRKINLVKRYEEEVEITALAGEIRQAFSNLISNSIDAMPGGGSFCIKVSSAHDWKGANRPGVRITFLDTGSGIEPQHRKNLFQPFFTTKSDVGTGLGLWITRNIVEKHQGTIHVISRTRPEEHGTAFSIFLPLNKQIEKSSKSEPSLTERVQGAA